MAVDSRRITIAPDTYVVLDPVPVQMATTAVESLCPPVVTQTRPKEDCDPATPRQLRRGRDVLREDSMVAVDPRRISIDQDTDVVSGIYVMPDLSRLLCLCWLRRRRLPLRSLRRDIEVTVA